MDGAHTHGSSGGKALGGLGVFTAIAFGLWLAAKGKAKDGASVTDPTTPVAPVAPKTVTVTVVKHASAFPQVAITTAAILFIVAMIVLVTLKVRRGRRGQLGVQVPQPVLSRGVQAPVLRPAARKAMEGDRVKAHLTQGAPIRTSKVG